MRDERDPIAGDITVDHALTLWAAVRGNVTVIEGGKLYVRGVIHGNLILDPGARVHIHGVVQGHVTLADNTKLVHSGFIGGSLRNHSGRAYIDENAVVEGKIKTGPTATTREKKSQSPASPTSS